MFSEDFNRFICFLFRPSRFVGDLSNLENRLRDQERLRKKIERASIPPFVVPIAHQQIVHITDANYNDSQLIFQRNFIIDVNYFSLYFIILYFIIFSLYL